MRKKEKCQQHCVFQDSQVEAELRCDGKVHKNVMEIITWVVNKAHGHATTFVLQRLAKWGVKLLFLFWAASLNQYMPIGVNCDGTEWLRLVTYGSVTDTLPPQSVNTVQ